MYWLRRPRHLRWLIAATLVAAGLVVEAGGAATERYPFAGAPIAAGSSIDEAIEWRDVPVGLLPAWLVPVTGVAVADVTAGYPLLPNLRSEVFVPSGWWSMPVPLPITTAPGTSLRLLNSTTGDQIDGIVTTGVIDDGFESLAMVAFSPDDAPRAAQAIASDAFVVMVGHGDGAAATNG